MSKTKTKTTTTTTRDHPLKVCAPRGDRVVVKRDMPKEQTAGGVLLTQSYLSGIKQQTGTVWSVGPGKIAADGTLIPVGLKKGDRVILTGWSGLEISNPDSAAEKDEWVMLREDDILACLPADWEA